MPTIRLEITGKGGAFASRFHGYEVVDLDDEDIFIETLDSGMASGKPSVAILLDIGQRRAVLAQTSVRLFQVAACAMYGKYGDQTDGSFQATLDLANAKAELRMGKAVDCPVCGKKVAATKFCGECGVKFGERL